MAVYTTIDNPELFFQTKLYTGNGSTQSITLDGDTDMQPDWVWIKNRSSVTNHEVADSVRGVNKLLKTNDTDAEQSVTTKITSFDSDGFGVGTDANVNGSGNSLASWNWKETATAGFDIVLYTGNGSNRTISHSCGAVPKMIIIKDRSAADNWNVYNSSSGNNSHMHLNLTNAASGSSSYWNTTTPTSSVFSLGSNSAVNANGNNFIAYCFAEKQGYSKIGGSYTGNGNADGVYLHLGFSPSFIMFKRTDSTGAWVLKDNKRDAYNVATKYLYANASDAESTSYNVDFTANGVKLRGSDAQFNASGGTFIYMAFAEAPFVTSTGIPTIAR
jgi:hypothetical protein